ncbi:hypothetical protein EON66_01070 [archaeon]|nr:MAG: hypothetical protein EON66_01070 [archaeon]
MQTHLRRPRVNGWAITCWPSSIRCVYPRCRSLSRTRACGGRRSCDSQSLAARAFVPLRVQPTWNGPVMDFIDAHCSVFDATDENKLVYTTIHEYDLTHHHTCPSL